MPGYEMALIMRVMKRPDLIEAVKRSLGAVIERGAIVKKLENLGENRLPYGMSAHTEVFNRGHYFVVEFDAPADSITPVQEYLHRDIDVIRPTILRRETEQRDPPQCLGPYSPIYRPSDKSMKNPRKMRRDVKLSELSK